MNVYIYYVIHSRSTWLFLGALFGWTNGVPFQTMIECYVMIQMSEIIIVNLVKSYIKAYACYHSTPTGPWMEHDNL